MLLGRGPAEPKRLGADSGDCLGPPRRCSRGVWPTPVSLGGEILKCSAAARRGKAWGQATSCPRCGHSCYNSGVWLPGSCCAFGEPGPCQQRCRRMPPKGKGKGKRVKQQKRRSAAGEFGVLPALRQQGCDPRIPAMLRRRRRRQQGPQGPAAPPGPGWGASKCQAPASTDLREWKNARSGVWEGSPKLCAPRSLAAALFSPRNISPRSHVSVQPLQGSCLE